LKVKDFMIRDTIVSQPDETVRSLLKKLVEHHIGGVPIVDEERHLLGMISDGDLVRYLVPHEETIYNFYLTIAVDNGESLDEMMKITWSVLSAAGM
jgi:CBS domain-containing protein